MASEIIRLTQSDHNQSLALVCSLEKLFNQDCTYVLRLTELSPYDPVTMSAY